MCETSPNDYIVLVYVKYVSFVKKEVLVYLARRTDNGLVTFEVIQIQRLKWWKRTKNSAKQVSASVISSVRSPACRASQRCRCWKHVWIWVHQSGKASERTCSFEAKFSFLCDMAISPDGGHWCIVMGQDRKTHQRAQRPELRFKATTKSMRFCGWEWLGCCTDRKTFCVCSFGPKVTVRGRGIKKKTSQKEGRKEATFIATRRKTSPQNQV